MQYQSGPTSDISINDVVDIIRRRRGFMLSCVLVCLAIGALVTLRSPRIYSATSQIVFYRPAYTVVMSGAAYTQPTVEDKSTQVYLLRGKAVAVETSRYLQNQKIDVTPDAVQAALRVSDIENTDLISISAETRDPDLSMRIANAAAEAFVLYKRSVGKHNQTAGMAMLRKQLEAAGKELARRERAVAQYAEKNAITDVKKESEARFQQIVAYETKLLDATMARDEAKGRANELARQLAIQDYAIKVTGVIRDNKRISNLREKLVDAELQLAAAEQKYTSKYPGKLDELRDSVAKTRAVLAKEIDNIVNYKAGSLDFQAELKQKLSSQETDCVALSARCEAIRRILASVRKEIIQQPMKEVTMTGLTRASTAAAQVYTTLLNSMEAIKSEAERQNDTIQITELASKPEKPVRPSPAKNMAFALLVGVMMAGFGVLVLERLDDTFRTPEDVKKLLGLPVLGLIPRMTEGARLLTDWHPHSPITEAYRNLRSNIAFVGIDDPVRSLLVTSASVSEGKSLTAINLAITIAQEGRRVIIVDADVRNPSVELFLGLLPGPGLTDVLRGEVTLEDALRPCGVPGLQVLTAGAVPPNPAELLGSQRMRDLIGQIEPAADVVIFDSSPCSMVSDALLLGKTIDATVQVVDAVHVSREAALQTKEALAAAGARIAGVVLNRSRPDPSFQYSYGVSTSSKKRGKIRARRDKR